LAFNGEGADLRAIEIDAVPRVRGRDKPMIFEARSGFVVLEPFYPKSHQRVFTRLESNKFRPRSLDRVTHQTNPFEIRRHAWMGMQVNEFRHIQKVGRAEEHT